MGHVILSFTVSPHAKACAQVAAPLVFAAMGLTVAAIACNEAQPRFSNQNVDTSRIAHIASSTPTTAPTLTTTTTIQPPAPIGRDARPNRQVRPNRPVRPPLPSPPFCPYIQAAVREGGYGDKWASE